MVYGDGAGCNRSGQFSALTFICLCAILLPRLSSALLQNRPSLAPHGDLTPDQQAVFETALKHPMVQQYVALWWSIYDNLRASGEIPATAMWNPD